MNGENKGKILEILSVGSLEMEGMLPWSSNYTFMVKVCKDSKEIPAVYKPKRGERPLWDFPPGTLCAREFAAFLVSDTLGWDIIPPTVLRMGEHGAGSVQLFIDHDPDQHYFTFEGQPLFRDSLQRLVLLDVIINNADRKGGHVIIENDSQHSWLSQETGKDRLWGIDHGITFHHEYKLRTVIWEFAGMKIPPQLVDDLSVLELKMIDKSSELNSKLESLLTKQELTAFEERIRHLIERAAFPHPGPGRHYPWPPV